MEIGEAQAMALRIARRLVKDQGADGAEDYVSIAALAIMRISDDDPALQWTVGKRTIIDEHRRLHGRVDTAKNQAHSLPLLEDVAAAAAPTDAEQIDLALQLHEAFKAREKVLTSRQVKVLQLLAEGHTMEEVGGLSGIKYETVRTTVRRIYEILGSRNMAHAIALGVKHGYINTENVKRKAA